MIVNKQIDFHRTNLNTEPLAEEKMVYPMATNTAVTISCWII